MPRDAQQPEIGIGHNSDLKSKDLTNWIDEWVRLQDKEDALIDEHCKSIREKKAAIKRKVEKRYGIGTTAFNARANLRRIELKKNNDRALLQLNDLFSAVPVAKGVDVDAAQKRVEAEDKAKADEGAKAKVTETEL